MTDQLIEHLKTVEKEIEAEKGQFSLFVLFSRPDSVALDLVVAAPWLQTEKRPGLALISKLVYSSSFPRAEWGQIARIVALNDSDINFRIIKDAIGPTNTLRVIDHPSIPGFDIDKVYVLSST